MKVESREWMERDRETDKLKDKKRGDTVQRQCKRERER